MDNLKPNKTIFQLKPHDKNLDLKVMLIEQKFRNRLKGEMKLTQFLAADTTGSILCNFFDEFGDRVKEGDILFLKGAYVSVFQNQLILYTNRPGLGQIIKMNEFFMLFSENPKISDKKLVNVKDEKTKKMIYTFDPNE